MYIQHVTAKSKFGEDRGDEFSLVPHNVPPKHIPHTFLSLVFKVSQASDRKTLYAESASALYEFCSELSSVVTTLRNENDEMILVSHYNGGVWDPYHVGYPCPDTISNALFLNEKVPVIRSVDPATFKVGWWYREPFYCLIPIYDSDDTDYKGVLALGFKTEPQDIETIIAFGQLISSAMSLAFQREDSLSNAMSLGQRIEREYLLQSVHDSAIQDVYAAEMALSNALESCKDDCLAAKIRDAMACMGRANTSLRSLLSEERQEAKVSPMGLGSLIHEEVARHVKAGGVPVETMISDTLSLAQPIAYALGMVLRESLCNVRKHAMATSVVIMGSERDGTIMLTVQDDGVGLSNKALSGEGSLHFGLANLKKVVDDMGGSFSIESQPGDGCAVRVRIPLTPGIEAL